MNSLDSEGYWWLGTIYIPIFLVEFALARAPGGIYLALTKKERVRRSPKQISLVRRGFIIDAAAFAAAIESND